MMWSWLRAALGKTRLFVSGESLVIPACVFALLPALLFHSILLRGRTLTPADILLQIAPWKGTLASASFRAKNSLLSDQILEFYPWSKYARVRIRDGEVPLWNPHAGCGRPFLANPQAGVFSLTGLPRYLMPLRHAPLATAWLHLFLAGFGMYLLLRTLGAGRTAGYVSGIAFAFSSFNIVWLGFPHVRVAVWAPWMFLIAHVLMKRPTPGRTVLFALVLAVQYLGGHPETSFHLVSFLLLFQVFPLAGHLIRRDVRGFSVRVLAFSAAGFLALLISGIQLMPFLEYLQRSDALAERGSHLSSPFLPWISAATALIPDIFGNPGRGGFGIPWCNYCEGTLYAGVVTLLLAPLAFLSGQRHRLQAVGFWFLLVVAIGVVFYLPGIREFITSLPGFHISANLRLILVAEFCLAAAAGLGVQTLMDHKSLRSVFWYVGLAGIGLAVLAAWGVHWFLFGKGTHSLDGPLTPVHLKLLTAGSIRFGLLLFVSVVLLLWRSSRRLPAAGFAVMLLLLLATDMTLFSRKFNPSVRASRVYPGHPVVAWLRAQPRARMVGLGVTMHPEVAGYYGLEDIRGFDAIEPRHMAELLRKTGLLRSNEYPLFSGISGPSPALNLLNVRYILSPYRMGSSSMKILEPGDTCSIRPDNRDGVRMAEARIHVMMTGADPIPGGAPVAVLEAETEGGECIRFKVRAHQQTPGAGMNPADGIMLRPGFDISNPFSQDSRIQSPTFLATFSFPGKKRWRALRIQYLLARGRLVVLRLRTRPECWRKELEGFLPVFRYGTEVHLNAEALPRVFLSARAEVAKDAAVHERLKDPAFDPRDVVLVDHCPAGVPTRGGPLPVTCRAALLEYLPERITVRVNTSKPALLVCGDTWFPGWRATVAETPAPVLRAYGALRAVPVPEGESRVVLEYRPRSYLYGKISTALGLCLCVGLLLLGRRKRSQDKVGGIGREF